MLFLYSPFGIHGVYGGSNFGETYTAKAHVFPNGWFCELTFRWMDILANSLCEYYCDQIKSNTFLKWKNTIGLRFI